VGESDALRKRQARSPNRRDHLVDKNQFGGIGSNTKNPAGALAAAGL
jgi:hypothetical protein